MWCSGSSVKKVFQGEGSDQPYQMPSSKTRAEN